MCESCGSRGPATHEVLPRPWNPELPNEIRLTQVVPVIDPRKHLHVHRNCPCGVSYKFYPAALVIHDLFPAEGEREREKHA